MTEHPPFDWAQAAPNLVFFGAALAGLHAWALYQLISGRASCWPWQTTSKITRWWLYRAEQPVAFWFRIGAWSFLCVVIDALIVQVLVERFG